MIGCKNCRRLREPIATSEYISNSCAATECPVSKTLQTAYALTILFLLFPRCRFSHLQLQTGHPAASRYDLGLYGNISAVLGDKARSGVPDQRHLFGTRISWSHSQGDAIHAMKPGSAAGRNRWNVSISMGQGAHKGPRSSADCSGRRGVQCQPHKTDRFCKFLG